MNHAKKIVEVKHLVKYFGKFCAVSDVSFDVYENDVFGFLGPNGAGKSTTLRMLLSLIKPTHGTIALFEKSLSDHRSAILSKVGCIVEKPDFYKYLSAQKNLEVFARISGIGISKTKIAELLEFVGLQGRANDKVSGFSHGMKQRLGIAQTLLHDPDLIILDEPTTGLDPQGIIDVRNLILQLKHEKRKTVILSSHILSEIERIANRMIIINKGKTVVQGNVADLVSSSALIVTFNLTPVDKALEVLQHSNFSACKTLVNNASLTLQTHADAIAQINAMFCSNDIQVSGIEVKRQLEDYFLQQVQSYAN